AMKIAAAHAKRVAEAEGANAGAAAKKGANAGPVEKKEPAPIVELEDDEEAKPEEAKPEEVTA
ncbi:hypothetical protein FBU31_003309, partial [Coemansia sp. 'formosensis']